MFLPAFFTFSHLISIYLNNRSHKMVDNKSKTSFIRYIYIYISLMNVNNIILVLHTPIILSSSFVIYIFFCICHLGSFPVIPTGEAKRDR